MMSFAEAKGREWRWERPRMLQRRWQLVAGDELLATLESSSVWHVAMSAETAGARWRLRHQGLFLGTVSVEREVAAGEFASAVSFRPAWFGAGRIECGGESLRWRRVDFLGRRWEIGTADGQPLLTFERLPGLFRAGARVLRSETAESRADLPELALLGWYLLVLMARQVQAAT